MAFEKILVRLEIGRQRAGKLAVRAFADQWHGLPAAVPADAPLLDTPVRNLPPDANPPVLNKANADSSPMFGLALRSERRTQLELSGLADGLRERLQTVPGVAAVDQPAEKRYAMRLWMDPEKLAAYGLSPMDVRRALARENLDLPSGRIEGESVELPVKTLSRLNTPAEFDALRKQWVEDWNKAFNYRQ